MRLVLSLAAAFILSSCKTAPVDRAPNQAHSHTPSQAFLDAEKVPRQHSLIFPDPKGHFGYHVSEFNSNHQHQYIVRGKLVPPTNDRMGREILARAEQKLTTKASRGYFSVTSAMPRFLLSELISGQRKEFLANMYDGLIIDRPVLTVVKNVKYQIEEKLFESPMHADEPRIPNSIYIVFGSYGAPKKTHYLAHLIKGANNFEQVLVADFENELVIPNGALMALGIEDSQPLTAGSTHQGQIDGQTVKFTVTKQVYFDKRTAAGASDY